MSHPNLGLPPRDLTAGHPAAAAAMRSARGRLATRAYETAVAADQTLVERHAELELRALLADLGAIVDQLATSVASGDPTVMAHWAHLVVPRYRKRKVPMDDVVGLLEALRRTIPTVVEPAAMAPVDAAIDAAIAVLRWNRRLGGDARKRNAFLAFIYKGA